MLPLPQSRRGFLKTTGAGVLGALILPGSEYAADPYEALRSRWRDLLTGTGFDPSAEPYKSLLTTTGRDAASFRSTMTPGGSALWPDLPLTVSLAMATSYYRLRTMALAYVQPGTGLTGNASVAADVLTGLDYMYGRVYSESTTLFDNWYHWQIGAPQALLDVVTLLYDHVTSSQIAQFTRAMDHFGPSTDPPLGASTGANRVDRCQVVALLGVINGDSHRLDVARDGLSPVFPYVTTGDGFYADGSFIQHRAIPYQGGYGAVLLRGFANLLYLLAGSRWAVTDPNRQTVFDAVTTSFAPVIYNGLCMDGFSGRGISRGASTIGALRVRPSDHTRGHAITAGILRLADAASPAEAARWRAMVKGWMQRESWGAIPDDPSVGVPDLARCLAVRDDRSIAATPEPINHVIFNNTDRAVHRRPTWAAALSMCSARTTFYETGNGENLRGWHTNNGMLYWWGSTDDNGQYGDAFWPTVDPYRLPGTTVSRKPLTDAEGGPWGQPKPAAVWAGGTTDGEFAALCQHVNGLDSTLQGKKSWFCLDDAIVCLGAGITCGDGMAVESIVENRNLGAEGSPSLTIDGTVQPSTLGWSASFNPAQWAAIAGLGAYVFPGGGRIKALREARTGRWRDINIRSANDPIVRRYLTLWFDHGVDPTNADYAYILMPGADSARAAARAAATSWLTVLANTGNQQGVSVPSLGVTAVNFWEGGTVGAVTADQPCSVMIREERGTATICVSDPSRAASTVLVTWNRAIASIGSKAQSVTVLDSGRSLQLRVAVGHTAGATQTCTVKVS